MPIDESPCHNLYQDWALGLILLKLWSRIVLLGPFDGDDMDPLLVAGDDDPQAHQQRNNRLAAGAPEEDLLLGGGGDEDDGEGIYTDRYWQREFELVHEDGFYAFNLRRMLRQIIMPICTWKHSLGCLLATVCACAANIVAG